MSTNGQAAQTVTNGNITTGNITTGGSVYEPWPNTWPSQTYVYPTYVVPADDYANEVEVERGEHDAVLRFYRNRDRSRTLVKELTVPLGVLDWLQATE